MHYVMVFWFIVLNMVVCVEAMNAHGLFLREVILFAAIEQPEVAFDKQPQKKYPQARPEDKKMVVKNNPCVQPRRKYASDKKLCALRSNKI